MLRQRYWPVISAFTLDLARAVGPTGRVAALNDALLRNPTTGIADRCACEARGHPTAAPPMSAVKSRYREIVGSAWRTARAATDPLVSARMPLSVLIPSMQHEPPWRSPPRS
jgi:hypothetical protein